MRELKLDQTYSQLSKGRWLSVEKIAFAKLFADKDKLKIAGCHYTTQQFVSITHEREIVGNVRKCF